MSDYQRVACSFYDQLEALSLRQVRCLLDIRNADGISESLDVLLTDVYAREGAEYLRTDSGREVRLDQIIRINGLVPAAYC